MLQSGEFLRVGAKPTGNQAKYSLYDKNERTEGALIGVSQTQMPLDLRCWYAYQEPSTMADNSFQVSSRTSLHSRLAATLQTLRLAVQSNNSGNIDKSLVVDLVSQLEFQDHFVCTRLESKICCTIIQTLLQCHNYRDSERGIYIFGVCVWNICSLHGTKGHCRLLCVTMAFHHLKKAS